MLHSGWAWRVCWWKERQDQKGVITVVLAPAEGKTRLERFNYSCTAPEGPIVVLLQKGRLLTKNNTRFGVSLYVRALAEGKTRLERCNYSSTAPMGPTPHRKQHTCWCILQCTCTGEGKTRMKGSNPSYPASTHYGVESDLPFWHDPACPPAEGNTRLTR